MPDDNVEVQDPIVLKEWIAKHRDQLNKEEKLPVFPPDKYQFQVGISSHSAAWFLHLPIYLSL